MRFGQQAPRVPDVCPACLKQAGAPTTPTVSVVVPAYCEEDNLLLVLKTFCRLGRKAIRVRTDHFHGFLFGGQLHTHHLKKLLRSLPPTGTCELMCHPGWDDPHTRYGHWGYHWADELAALIDPEVADLLRERGVQLISYRQLARV
jgi:predicted glycoside hydrolase/deacetylase ChbG (UPF0249 family)